MKRLSDQTKQVIYYIAVDYIERNHAFEQFKKKRKTELATDMLKICDKSLSNLLQKNTGSNDTEYKVLEIEKLK